ncbi:glycosyltransferase family 2 protein [Maricaulaceae bacterium EIL42A08]|nr:glycosyltransferase family 2 protein [Maricaulaceae bacterium EIL42A08]
MPKQSALPALTIIVPCYNEEAVLSISVPAFRALIDRLKSAGKISGESHLLFVDDGSKDGTWSSIERFAQDHGDVRGLKLTRNRGHQNAVLAGMMEAEGDLLVTIDADLQDDHNAIEGMIDIVADAGAQIVYGVRNSRDADKVFKRVTAEGFYRLLQKLGVEVVFNHADFRLLTRSAVESLRNFEEVNLFLRGMIPMLGYKTAIVEYARGERVAGESKYPLLKMLSLAWEGVTSLSIRPLRVITSVGAAVAIMAFAGALISIGQWLAGVTVSGWASLIVAVSMLGGMQLLAIGMVGEYVGKMYLEVKQRPRYIIEQSVP